MTFDTALVVGAGTMGQGIAQLLVEAGLRVQLYDTDGDRLGRAIDAIAARLQRRGERGQLGAPPAAVTARLRPVRRLEEAGAADLAIEAVPEKLDLKLAVVGQLDRLLRASAVIASNTSGLDVALLAAASARPERVLGLHFFNPPPAMPLVEVVRAPGTAPEVVAAVCDLARRLGKTPIEVANRPGFAVNRILFAMVNEAIRALSEGVAPAADIDRALRLGASHPIGPLALADFVGLDVTLDILESLEVRLGERYRPCDLLRQLVAAGRLGRKSGQGFFDYGSAPTS